MEREIAQLEAKEAIAKARGEADVPFEAAASVDIAPREDDGVLDGLDSDDGVAIVGQPGLDLRAGVVEVNPAAFFDESYDGQLRAMVEQIIELEGPIRDTALARKIARGHGWQRTGARIHERISAIALSCFKHTEEDVGIFFWADGRGPDAPIAFKGNSDAGRNVEEICKAELRSLAKSVLAEGKMGDGAVVAMAKRLGMHHVRAASRERFESALEAAQQGNSEGGDV